MFGSGNTEAKMHGAPVDSPLQKLRYAVNLSLHNKGMQEFYIIGVDIGTGSTKAVAVGSKGRVLLTAQRHYQTTTEGEKSEQDPGKVFRAFQQSVGEVVAALQSPPLAVSLSSAMHSILAVGAKGEPLTNAILWSDTRSSKVADALRGSSLGKKIYEATGTPLHSMSPLCKIRWLQQEAPALFAKAAKFVSIKEFIWHRLFSEWVIDHSVASATGLFNGLLLQWEEEALRFAGITPQQLSAPVPVTYGRQGIRASMASSMGVPSGTRFFVGASDGALANLGSLCLSPSEAAVTIGTSGAVRITSKKPVPDFSRMLFNYRLDEEHFVCGGAINNGGNVFQWLLKNLFASRADVTNYGQLFDLIATVPPGSEGLLFLPYLHGERAPIWDERSCGAFVGVTQAHDLSHFARAAAEGVCFALYDVLSSLEDVCGAVAQITVSGGLVQARPIMQLLADVTGKEVVVQQTEDSSAMGAVYLAQKALGLIPGYEALEKTALFSLKPQEEVHRRYQRLFSLYRTLYPQLRAHMHWLHQIDR